MKNEILFEDFFNLNNPIHYNGIKKFIMEDEWTDEIKKEFKKYNVILNNDIKTFIINEIINAFFLTEYCVLTNGNTQYPTFYSNFGKAHIDLQKTNLMHMNSNFFIELIDGDMFIDKITNAYTLGYTHGKN